MVIPKRPVERTLIAARVEPVEHRRAMLHAESRGTTVSAEVRRLLRADGLFDPYPPTDGTPTDVTVP